jgi:hypothetical protein
MSDIETLRKEVETIRRLLNDMSGQVAGELNDLKKRVGQLEKGPPPTDRPIGVRSTPR